MLTACIQNVFRLIDVMISTVWRVSVSVNYKMIFFILKTSHSKDVSVTKRRWRPLGETPNQTKYHLRSRFVRAVFTHIICLAL